MKRLLDSVSVPLGGALVGMLLLIGPLHGQDRSPAETHPWARFGVGSWKQVRVVNQSLNPEGQVESTSITDTKTTLVEVTKSGYTLKVEATVEVAGRRFPAEPKTVRQGFYGESNGQSVTLQTAGSGELAIDGQKYPVELRRVEINGDNLKRISTISFSPQVSPHVLRRETKATDVNENKPSYEVTVEVIAIDMPYRVLSHVKPVAHVKTLQKQASGATSVTLEVHCDEVPGGVVAHAAKEVSATGQVLAQSTLDLVAYHSLGVFTGTENIQTGRRRMFNRNRNR